MKERVKLMGKEILIFLHTKNVLICLFVLLYFFLDLHTYTYASILTPVFVCQQDLPPSSVSLPSELDLLSHHLVLLLNLVRKWISSTLIQFTMFHCLQS